MLTVAVQVKGPESTEYKKSHLVIQQSTCTLLFQSRGGALVRLVWSRGSREKKRANGEESQQNAVASAVVLRDHADNLLTK